MAVAQRLPNGHIILTLTPREATDLSDEILDPGMFPWQGSESQMTAFEIRNILRGLVAQDAMDRIREMSHSLQQASEDHRREQDQT